jgi:small GTP-binding protein
MASIDDLLKEFPESARPAVRRAWDALPEPARGTLQALLAELPANFTHWRTLLDLASEQVRMAAGGKGRVVIVGPANVGKTTLYNQLVRTPQDRAEASPVPGTTRMSQEADAGLFAVVDTPGADAVGEVGEAEKERAFASARGADFLLVVFDAIQGIKQAERELFLELAALGKPQVVVLNKTDLVGKEAPRVLEHAARALGLDQSQMIPCVAKDGTNFDRLLRTLAKSEPRLMAALGAALPAYRRVLASSATRRAAATAAAVALAPLPVMDLLPLLAVQSSLVLAIARLYRYRITLSRARELLATFGLGFLGRTLFQELSKLGGPPGWALGAAIAASTTAVMGYAATSWFEKGERITRSTLKQMTRATSAHVLERLRGLGRRRPARGLLVERVDEALEGAPLSERTAPP